MAKNPPSRYEIQDPMRALVMREAGLRDGRGGTPSAIAGSLMSGGMFDPAIGRAYRIGGTEVIPSGTLQFEPIVTNHGQADVVTRWKVTLKGTDPDHHIAAGRGAHLRFLVGTKMESDYIIRRGTIHVRTQNPNPNLLVQALDALDQGGAVTLYCVGRSLDVKVLNENAVAGNDLTVDYAIDEADSGLSIWHDLQTYNMILAGGIVETGFNIPP
ncbi:MAG: hypothetical protein NTW26_00350, partial [bacterium]|nr:hypothetical protein [bacterium]